MEHWERLCQRICGLNCDADLAAESLATHCHDQHGLGRGDLGGTSTPLPPPPRRNPTCEVYLSLGWRTMWRAHWRGAQ